MQAYENVVFFADICVCMHLRMLMFKNIDLYSFYIYFFHLIPRDQESWSILFTDVAQWLAHGKLSIIIRRTFPCGMTFIHMSVNIL